MIALNNNDRFFTVLAILSFIACGCSKEVIRNSDDSFINQYSIFSEEASNNSEVLRILSIGNSLGEDALTYLPDILRAADVKKVKLGRLCCLGISFKDHYNFFINNTPKYTFYLSSNLSSWYKDSSINTLRNALLFDEWDVIVFQDASGYSSFLDMSAYGMAKEIVDYARAHKSNFVSFYWHLPWSYGRDYNGTAFASFEYSQKKMDEYILGVDSNLSSLGYGIIPSYEVFSMLRKTSINNPPLDLTRDGFHSDYGAGRYAASCTWYQTLIFPFSHISIEGNSFRLNKGNVMVDDTVASICQEAVSTVLSKRRSLAY